jgi:hypothetical protein
MYSIPFFGIVGLFALFTLAATSAIENYFIQKKNVLKNKNRNS